MNINFKNKRHNIFTLVFILFIFSQCAKNDDSTSNLTIDTDNDGVIDSEDNCPNEIGSLENNGCPAGENCYSSHIPIAEGSSIVMVGNSFLGNNGSICSFLEPATVGSPLNFSIDTKCDIMVGNPLENMYDADVINDAESGLFNIGMFISGEMPAMLQFDELYKENCITPVLFMTWESNNPVDPEGNPILSTYRNNIAIIANKCREFEINTGSMVIPYGVLIYDLTIDPPLDNLPVNYMYESRENDLDNIHDNALGFWVKSNLIYAALTNSSPLGIVYNNHVIDGSNINTIYTEDIVLNEELRTLIQQRAWEVIQNWRSGMSIESMLKPVPVN